MVIELDNQTAYRDDDLRALVRAAVKAVGARVTRLRLRVVYTRQRHDHSGCASCVPGGRRWILADMTLRIVRDSDPARLDSFKRVILHEAMHLAGATHSTMTEEQLYCTGETPDWARDLPLRTKEPQAPEDKAGQVAALKAERLEQARAGLKRAITRAKRAATLEKKWRRRVAALERGSATETPEKLTP